MPNRVYIEMIGKSARLLSEFDTAKRGAAKFSSAVKNEFKALSNLATSFNGQLAGIGLSFGAVQITKNSAQLDKELTQIGQTAGETKQAVADLRGEVYGFAKYSGQEVEDLTDGFNNLVQAGQSWKAALESTGAINIASGVTGAGSDILAGGLTVGAEAYEIDIEQPGKALELLDKMVVAGRLGNAELENLSSIFSRVGVNAASAGMGFDQTLAFLETLSLVERRPERLATLADSSLRLFTNLTYMKNAMQVTKVNFFDENGMRRDAIEVLKDIKKEYDKLDTEVKRAVFIQKAFGSMDQDTIKGMRSLLQGDSLAKTEEFAETITTASGTLRRDFNDATDNLIDQGGRFKQTMIEGADAFVTPVKDVLKDLIKWSLDTKENGGLELSGKQIIAGGLGIAAGSMLLTRYGGKFIGAAGQKLLGNAGSAAAGIGTGLAVQKATGVTPVFVTNWPAGFGAAAAVDAAAGSGGLLKKMGSGAKKSWKWLAGLGSTLWTGGGLALSAGSMGEIAAGGAATVAPAAGLVAAAGAGGWGIGTLLERYLIDGTAVGDAIGKSLNQVAAFFGSEASKEALQINLRIDEERRVTAESNSMRTEVNTDLRRGRFSD